LIEYFFLHRNAGEMGCGDLGLRTGSVWLAFCGQDRARCRDLLPEYPRGPACWRRLRQWEEEQGFWLQGWRALLASLNREQLLGLG